MNATKLRDLDAFEEFFWLLEQSANVAHAVIAEVKGATTIRQWKDAMDGIQIRYPLLSASILKVPGKRFLFEKRREFQCPCGLLPYAIPGLGRGDGERPSTIFWRWKRSRVTRATDGILVAAAYALKANSLAAKGRRLSVLEVQQEFVIPKMQRFVNDVHSAQLQTTDYSLTNPGAIK